jgi:hypothetical protein
MNQIKSKEQGHALFLDQASDLLSIPEKEKEILTNLRKIKNTSEE